jgi:hypothetical protein
MNTINYEHKKLRELGVDERWLQNKIEDDPSILGLGDLNVIERERSQNSGGRLDFLMYDPDDGARYEIEVMLGRLDESHIIRTIEYWDLERKKYPNREHRAVIVAEEITSRFYNVINLFNQAIPLIALQLDALVVDAGVLLHFTKIIDVNEISLGEEQEVSQPTDLNFWKSKSNPKALEVVEEVQTLLKGIGINPRLTYNKYHIALGTTGRNFMWFHPRKSAAHCSTEILFDTDSREEFLEKLEEAGFSVSQRKKKLNLKLSHNDLLKDSELLKEVFRISESLAVR